MDIQMDINAILEKAAKASEFSFMEEFSIADISKMPEESLCICSVKSQSYSPKMRSVSGEVYGVEVQYRLKIRLLGKRTNYGDYTDFCRKATSFINYLGLSSDLIITRLNRDETKRNTLLSRLETEVDVQLKCCFLSSEIDSGGGA